MIKLVNVYQAGRIISGAEEFLYKLLAERPPEASISHKEMPTIEQHRAFITRRPYRAWYLVENEAGIYVGCVNATHQNEIGVAISLEHQRKGYALAALEKLLGTLAPLDPVPSQRRGTFIANVLPTNMASQALFKSLGGNLVQFTYELSTRGST